MDVVGDLKAGVLAHGLDLADDLADKALLDQLRAQVRIQDHGHIGVLLGDEALPPGHIDQQVVLGQDHLCPVKGKGQRAGLVQGIHGLIAIQLRQGGADLPQELPVLGTYGL